MIVQCEHCQTKYRIADEKVKGKGVKVRCAKCENVFTVTPPEGGVQAPQAEAPPPPEEPAGPPPPQTPVPPLSEDPTDAHASGEGPAAERPPGPAPAPSDLPPLPSLGGDMDVSRPEGDEPPPPGELEDQSSGGPSPPSPEEGALDFGSQRPAHEMDQGGTASPPPSEGELPGEGGFEIEGTLREDTPLGSEPAADSADVDSGADHQGAEAGAEWGNISIDGQPSGDPDSGGIGLTDSPGYTAPPPVPFEDAGEQPLPDTMDGPAPETTSIPSYQAEERSSGGGMKWLVLLLLLAAIGAGGYFAYPKVMDLIGSRGEQTEGTLTPANIVVKALTRVDGRVIYSVRGQVRNESAGNVGMIQVEAQFRNVNGDVLSTATSYSGNILDDRDLANFDMDRIRSDLQNELGQSLSNASVGPGETVPFLIVLDNPPSGVSKVTVTITSFKETS